MYLFGAYLIKKYSIDTVFNKINNDPANHISKEGLRLHFGDFPDMNVNMIDLNSKRPIVVAARGVDCTHSGIFDLRTFLLVYLNSKGIHNKCPICLKECNKFLIDDFLTNFLKERREIERVPITIQINRNFDVTPDMRLYS